MVNKTKITHVATLSGTEELTVADLLEFLEENYKGTVTFKEAKSHPMEPGINPWSVIVTRSE